MAEQAQTQADKIKQLESIVENLEYQIGCWHQDYLADHTDESYAGLVDAENRLWWVQQELEECKMANQKVNSKDSATGNIATIDKEICLGIALETFQRAGRLEAIAFLQRCGYSKRWATQNMDRLIDRYYDQAIGSWQ